MNSSTSKDPSDGAAISGGGTQATIGILRANWVRCSEFKTVLNRFVGSSAESGTDGESKLFLELARTLHLYESDSGNPLEAPNLLAAFGGSPVYRTLSIEVDPSYNSRNHGTSKDG